MTTTTALSIAAVVAALGASPFLELVTEPVEERMEGDGDGENQHPFCVGPVGVTEVATDGSVDVYEG